MGSERMNIFMMKPILVLAAVVAVASAGNAGFAGGFGSGGGGIGFSGNQGGYSGGGLGGYNKNVGGGHNGEGGYSGGFSGGGGGFGNGFNSGGSFNGAGSSGGGGVVRKFISVHVGPEEAQNTQVRTIRVGQNTPDKHINIFFVKAPSRSSQQNTEVILPEPPKQKTLVYVLVKKQESKSNVRVRGPVPTKPSKPEVYFIRYKDGTGAVAPASQGYSGDAGGGVPGPAYGSPHQGGVPLGGGY